jgi:hypothetical protein
MRHGTETRESKRTETLRQRTIRIGKLENRDTVGRKILSWNSEGTNWTGMVQGLTAGFYGDNHKTPTAAK